MIINPTSANLNKPIFGQSSLVKEINLSFGHDHVYYGHIIDIVPTNINDIHIKYDSSQFPECELADLLIMLAEEIRFKLRDEQ